MESIVFHARRNADNAVPAFTARFGKEGIDNESLYCVVSKPHPRLESYCKKTGNAITEARLNCLISEFNSGTRAVVHKDKKKEIGNFLPRGVVNTLGFYATRAKKFFQVENPRIIIRGTELIWERTEYGSHARKTPVIIITDVKSLS